MSGAADEQSVAPPQPAPWRLLLVGGILAALYVAIAWLGDDVESSPGWIAGAVAVGALVGAATARFVPRTPARARPTPTRAAVRATMTGLTGSALILAQSLSADGVRWMTLGGIALAVGAATRGWLTDRRSRHQP